LISGIYVDQARSAFAKGDYSTVSSLIRVAEEFDPTASDALYLRGEVLVRTDIPEAILSYREALDRDNWSRFDSSEAKLKLAPLLIRTKQFRAAAHLLEGLGTTSADYLLYTAQALIGEGKDYQARNLLSGAGQSYPADDRFAILRVKIDPTYRSELLRGFTEVPGAARYTKALAEALIQTLSDPIQKLKAISAFNAHFGSAPLIRAQSLLASSSVTTAQIDSYVGDGLLANAKLTEAIYAHLAPGPVRSYLGSKLASYTGNVTLDTNGDGFPEETADYSSGVIDHLKADMNQDGVPDYDVSFSKGVPSSLHLMSGGIKYAIVYSTYPFLASASFEAQNQKTNYTLEPDRVSLPLFGARSLVPSGPENFPPIVNERPAFGEKELFAFASQVTTTNATTSTPVSLWKKSLDDILVLEQEWNGGRYAYKAVYHHGEKFSAEIDLDNDGYYEVHEHYDNGKLERLTYDRNHNAVPEFILTLNPYPTLSWDFNQDGLIDEVEKKTGPNTTILEFSTKMNGVFDVVTKEVTP